MVQSFPIAYVALCPTECVHDELLPVRSVFDRVPRKAIEIAAAAEIRVRVLSAGETYREGSGVLRRLGVDVDAWPNPPAGLFVVEERTMHLRLSSPMTIAHEFGHALDCALGGGVYRSSYDPEIRSAFRAARNFVTPYAALGIDEYFAECFRSAIEVNDALSPWPSATREILERYSPQMMTWFERELGLVQPVTA